MKKPIVIGAGILLVLLLVRIGVSLANQGDDRTQIRDALDQSLKASRDGKSGGVMDLLSSKLTYNNSDAGSALPQVVNFIRSNRPEITVENPDPVVKGDSAEIDSPVDVKLQIMTFEKNIHLNRVVLVFQKEHVMKWAIFPTTQWRLVQVESNDSLPTDLLQ
jgi:hypothetical protein